MFQEDLNFSYGRVNCPRVFVDKKKKPSMEKVMSDDKTDHEEVKSKEEEVQQFCIEILPLVKVAQNQHGLRHGDYQRYRSYCSRRIRRIRKSLKFTSGHRHRYQKKPLTAAIINDPRYLYIPLYSAERAWSLAMELKQDAVTEPRKKHHLIRRLRKANKIAQDLCRLSEETGRSDARSKLEIQAYCDWMNGNVMFELQNWKEALDSFSASQTVYQKLGSVVSEDQRQLYAQRVEEITPNLRYCAYNIGGMPTDVTELMKLRTNTLGSDILASKIDEVLAKTGEKAALSLTEVQWKGGVVPIKNQQVRIALIKLNQTVSEVAREESTEEKMKLYERLLMDCQDAVQMIRDEMNQEKSSDKKRSQKQEQLNVHRQLLIEYLSHLKLTQSIQRNLLLLETFKTGNRKAKPEEFVRVYDILLQHVAELSDLTEDKAQDLMEAKHCTAQTFMFKSYRCFYLSESYTMMKKWPESIGLLGRAEEHAVQAIELFREWGKAEAENSLVKLKQLQETIRGKKCELQVKGVIESQGLEEQMSELNLSDKPLSECLDIFNPSISYRDVTLAPVPPDFKSVAGKPVFFDLALDHIEFPSLAHRAEKKGGGLTGFVKGLFWGKS